MFDCSASSEFLTKSSIDRRKEIRRVTSLKRCRLHVKCILPLFQNEIHSADCLNKAFRLLTSAVAIAPGLSSYE